MSDDNQGIRLYICACRLYLEQATWMPVISALRASVLGEMIVLFVASIVATFYAGVAQEHVLHMRAVAVMEFALVGLHGLLLYGEKLVSLRARYRLKVLNDAHVSRRALEDHPERTTDGAALVQALIDDGPRTQTGQALRDAFARAGGARRDADGAAISAAVAELVFVGGLGWALWSGQEPFNGVIVAMLVVALAASSAAHLGLLRVMTQIRGAVPPT